MSFNFSYVGQTLAMPWQQNFKTEVSLIHGGVKWSYTFSSGVYDFGCQFQQILLPHSPDLRWNLFLFDNFGSDILWQWDGPWEQFHYTTNILGFGPSVVKHVGGFFDGGPVFMQCRPVFYSEEP